MASICLSSGPESTCTTPSSTPPASPTWRKTSKFTSDWLEEGLRLQRSEAGLLDPLDAARAVPLPTLSTRLQVQPSARPALKEGRAVAPQAGPWTPEAAEPSPGYRPASMPPPQTQGPTGGGLTPEPAMAAAAWQQPDAPLTLTSAQAKWVPRWFVKGAGLSAHSAVPEWMTAGAAGNAGGTGLPPRRATDF